MTQCHHCPALRLLVRLASIGRGLGKDLIDAVHAAVDRLALERERILLPTSFHMHQVEEPRAECEAVHHVDGDPILGQGGGKLVAHGKRWGERVEGEGLTACNLPPRMHA